MTKNLRVIFGLELLLRKLQKYRTPPSHPMEAIFITGMKELS